MICQHPSPNSLDLLAALRWQHLLAAMQARWTRQIQEATSKPESTFLWWVEWTTPQRGWHLFGFGLCGSSSAPLIRMPFPFAGVAPFAFGRRPLSRASISFPPPLPLSKGKVPLGPASTLRLTLRLRNRKAFASTLWFGDWVAFGATLWVPFGPPMPATRNKVPQRLKPPKVTTFGAIPIGTAIGPSCEWLRTVANSCATSSEHSLNPQPPERNGNPCYAVRKRGKRAKEIT